MKIPYGAWQLPVPSVILASLKLVNVRGYESLSLPLGPRLTVLAGDNAQGKTNLLRAVEALGLGDASAAPGDLLRHGAGGGFLEGRLDGAPGPERLAAEVTARSFKLSLNGKTVPRGRWIGRLPVLFVGPEDRDQVTGPPSARRTLLDELLLQAEPAYLAALREYRRALRQRNRALARVDATDAEVAIWEEPMARAGGVLLARRVRAVEALAPRTAAWHGELGAPAGRDLELRYEATVPGPAGASEAAWADALAAALEAGRPGDRAYGSSLAGPHRDEVAIVLAGRPLKHHGSSGEIWTAILALALGCAEHLGARLGRLPLLLLDDVLAALDGARRERLLAVLEGLPQALLTTTQAPEIGTGTAGSRAVLAVRAHAVTPLTTAPNDATWERDRTHPAPFAQC
jgi:DNA replication and repair protein RecF